MALKEIREVLAEARLGCTYLNDTIGGGERIKYARVDADNILASLDAAGYVIMPREPTEAMLTAGPPEPYMDRDVWAAMINAALNGSKTPSE